MLCAWESKHLRFRLRLIPPMDFCTSGSSFSSLQAVHRNVYDFFPWNVDSCQVLLERLSPRHLGPSCLLLAIYRSPCHCYSHRAQHVPTQPESSFSNNIWQLPWTSPRQDLFIGNMISVCDIQDLSQTSLMENIQLLHNSCSYLNRK